MINNNPTNNMKGNLRYFKERNVSIFMIFLLSAVSWVSTFTGILAFMGSGSEGINPIAAIVAGALTMVVQIVIVVAANRFMRNQFLYIVPWLASLVISVGFAMAFYVKQLHVEAGIIQAQVAETHNIIKQQVVNVQNSFNQATSTLVALAEHSNTQAEIEDDRGGTCTINGSGRPTKGPRYRLRKLDQHTLNGYVSSVKSAENKADQIFSQLPEASDETRLTEMAMQINALVEGSGFTNMQEWLGKRVKQGGNADSFYDAPTQSYFSCYDQEFDARAGQVLAQTLAPIALPDIHRVTATSHLERGYETLYNLATGQFEKVSEQEYVPLMLALMVDLGILLFTHLVISSRNRLEYKLDHLVEQILNGPSISNLQRITQADSLENTIFVLNQFIVKVGRDSYLLYLPHSHEPVILSLRRLVFGLEEEGLVKSVPFSQLFVKFKSRLVPDSDNGYAVYKMDGSVVRHLNLA